MMTRSRLILDILLFFLVVTGIAPLLLFVAFIGAYRERLYAEALFAGFLFELLYGTGVWSWPVPFPVFLGSVALYLFAVLLRSRMR